jgi:hypothetical protein
MFVGYSVYHANDVYRMLNLDNKSIIQSRNIIWLNEADNDWIEKKFHKRRILMMMMMMMMMMMTMMSL